MNSLHIYRYDNGIVPPFRIFAPSKHGTRWLELNNPTPVENKTQDPFRISLLIDLQDFDKNLNNHLFNFIDNPKSTNKIKLSKKINLLNEEHAYFVYRNPYDAFISAIQTVYADSENNKFRKSTDPPVWSGNPNDLDIIMTDNGHHSINYYRKLVNILYDLNETDITFLNIEDLSKFFRLNTLKNVKFTKNTFTFNHIISKEEITNLCKQHHSLLWKRFMGEIEKEQIALDKLIKKFDWKNKFITDC
jgi:hypothetical protein